MKRIFTVLACALLLVGTATSPAAASHTDYTSPTPDGWLRNIVCPYPYLATPLGPLSLCTSGIGIPEPAEFGWYSPYTNDFNTNRVDYATASSVAFQGTVTATDGVRGYFKGGYPLETGFGRVSYGIQYTTYLLKPIGRFGNYSYITHKFHPDPNLEWYHTQNSHPY